jgi:hypothetical protein
MSQAGSLTEPLTEMRPVASNERIQALDVVRGFRAHRHLPDEHRVVQPPDRRTRHGPAGHGTGRQLVGRLPDLHPGPGQVLDHVLLLFGMGFAD